MSERPKQENLAEGERKDVDQALRKQQKGGQVQSDSKTESGFDPSKLESPDLQQEGDRKKIA